MRADHPFIVKLKSSFQTDVRIYMVMELCLGGELYLHLRRQSKFDESAVKFYAAEIILAMQYLHEKLHLIHRYLFIISLKLSYLSIGTSNQKMSSSALMVTSNLPISVSPKV